MDLTKRTDIPLSTINEIIKDKCPISTETAFALGTFFNMNPQYWSHLQSPYNMRRVEIEKSTQTRARVRPLVV